MPGALRALLETRSAFLTDLASPDDGEERVLVRSDLNGTVQLYDLAGGVPRQITAVAHRVARPKLSLDGKRVYYSLTTPRRAGAVWMFARTPGVSAQLTASSTQLDPAGLARLEAHRTVSFDAEVVPLLFVVHGRNDPRVPSSESGQLVRRLEERGVRCELSVYDDEGHGLARLPNRMDAYSRAVDFLDEVLCV